MNSKLASLLSRGSCFFSRFCKKESLFLIVGDKGVYVQYSENNIIADTYFSPTDQIEIDENFKNFILKRPKVNVKIILNFKDIKLDHQSISVFSGFNKSEPILKYCSANFHKSDLFSYKPISVTKENQDIWKYVISSTPLSDTIQRCLLYISESRAILEGIYFYNFLVQDICTKISEESKENLQNIIYTTTSISSTSGISFSVNHGNDIISSSSIDYPFDKSPEYIQGLIEQNISDIWIKYSAYSSQNNLKKYNIFIVPESLKNLLEKQYCGAELNLFSKSSSDSFFSEQIIIKYTESIEPLKALSSELKSYYRFSSINEIIFKPFYLILVLTFSYLIYLNICHKNYNNNLSVLYEKFSKYSEEIRLKSENFPAVSNMSQLADYYKMQKLLAEDKKLPFQIIADFLNINENNNEINSIIWSVDNNNQFTLDIEILVNSEYSNKNFGMERVENIIKLLKEKHENINIDTQRVSTKSDSITSKNTSSMTLKITIRG